VVHRSPVLPDTLLADVPGLHEAGRELRRSAQAARSLAVRASSRAARADLVPVPLRSGLLHALDSVRRALDAEAAAVDRTAAAVDAAAHEYVAQELRAASALAG
jgi:hypothetical protein